MRGFRIWSQNCNRTIFDPLFGRKTVKIWQFWLFCQFVTVLDSFLVLKGVKFYRISILRPDLESSHPGETSWPKNERKLKLYFLATYGIFKTSTNLRPSLHLTDRAQILYTVFWYHKTTFETLTPCTFQKKNVFRSTLLSSLLDTFLAWLYPKSRLRSIFGTIWAGFVLLLMRGMTDFPRKWGEARRSGLLPSHIRKRNPCLNILLLKMKPSSG